MDVMELLIRWGLPILAVIISTVHAYNAGEKSGRKKGFTMTMWALEKGYIGVRDDDDGGKVILVSDELAKHIDELTK